MEPEQLFTGSKWELLEQLAKRPQSTSELAKKLRTSQANVSQQLRQLELAGIVSRERTERKNVHYQYTIAEPFLYVVTVGPRTAQKKTFHNDRYQRFLAGLLMNRHGGALLALVAGQPDVFKRFDAVGVLDRERPELFVLAQGVDEIRQHHANIEVKTPEGNARVVVWSHTPEELRDGLTRKEGYFADMLKDITLLYDPEGTLEDAITETEAIQ